MDLSCAPAWLLVCCAIIAALKVLHRAREALLLRVLREVPSIMITGAAHGIGKEIAIQGVQAGVRAVILLDVDAISLKECRDDILKLASASQTISTILCDVSEPEQVQRACEEALTMCGGHIDVLVSNAGVAYARDVEDVEPAALQRCYGVNTFASFYLLQHILPVMRAHRRGCVVLMSSVMSMIGSAQLSPYVSSKFALRGLGECVRMELARDGLQHDIPVITACPYATRTGMFDAAFEDNWNPIRQVLFPLLGPASVATEVLRTIAIRRNNVLVIPFLLHVSMRVCMALPLAVFDRINGFFGGYHGFSGPKPQQKPA